MPGRTLYVADFNTQSRTILNAKPFANPEGKAIWFDYPRWTKDESAIVYHAGGKLMLYTLADGTTRKVSTDNKADYRYPHGEADAEVASGPCAAGHGSVRQWDPVIGFDNETWSQSRLQ